MRFVYKVGVVILLASFFLMSHNAFAVDTTIDISNYEVISNAVTLNVNCKFNAGALDVTNAGICGGTVVPAPSGGYYQLQRIYSNNTYTFQPGDIVEFDLLVYTTYGTNSQYSMQNANIINYPFRVLSIKEMADSELPQIYQNDLNFSLRNSVFYVYHYELIYVGPNNGQYSIGWNSGYSSLFQYFGDYYFRFVNYIQYRPSDETQVNKEQREATEEAVQESEDTAQDNSSSGQTTNLIGAFQSFVTALTNLSASNCNVTLAWPSSLGGNMQVNICQNKDYAGNIISVFGSLTLIVFYIPFSLKLLSMIYNEIRSFTNG